MGTRGGSIRHGAEKTITSFGEAGEVVRLLQIARRHLALVQRTGPVVIPGVKPDHALVASIFSAAAIEAGLNLFIAAPVLFIRDDALRRFYADFINRAARASVPDKLRFVKRVCPEVDRALTGRVQKLFEYRNAALHSTPDYGEPKALRPTVWKRARRGESITLTDADFETLPVLTGRATGSEEIALAAEHYETAKAFLRLLKPVVPQRRSRPKRAKPEDSR